MTTGALYRTATIVFLVFAAGHTLGFLSFTPPTHEGIAVRDAMNSVHFMVAGTNLSYGGFYRGFGLSATVSMLFEAFLAWQLAAIARLAPRLAASLTWALCAVQATGFGLSCLYFALPPAFLSRGLAVLLGFAARRIPRGRRAIAGDRPPQGEKAESHHS
jgi:hypothetical protein